MDLIDKYLGESKALEYIVLGKKIKNKFKTMKIKEPKQGDFQKISKFFKIKKSEAYKAWKYVNR